MTYLSSRSNKLARELVYFIPRFILHSRGRWHLPKLEITPALR